MAAHTHSRVEVEEQLSGGIGRALVDGVTDLGVFADYMPAHGLTTRLFQIDELVLLCAGMRVRLRWLDVHGQHAVFAAQVEPMCLPSSRTLREQAPAQCWWLHGVPPSVHCRRMPVTRARRH